jgi:putative hydrolase of the HAD superfamily
MLDYGMVLSLDQGDDDRRSMAETAGVTLEQFSERYWACRDVYDQGRMPSSVYWANIAGRPIEMDEVDALVALDVASWLHLNPATFAAAGDAAESGLRLAVLSNAPHEVADAIDEVVGEDFEVRLFSSRLDLLKPDPAIYQAALKQMGGTDPADVWFFDDRQPNVDGALALGLRAVRFESAEQLRRLLGL